MREDRGLRPFDGRPPDAHGLCGALYLCGLAPDSARFFFHLATRVACFEKVAFSGCSFGEPRPFQSFLSSIGGLRILHMMLDWDCGSCLLRNLCYMTLTPFDRLQGITRDKLDRLRRVGTNNVILLQRRGTISRYGRDVVHHDDKKTSSAGVGRFLADRKSAIFAPCFQYPLQEASPELLEVSTPLLFVTTSLLPRRPWHNGSQPYGCHSQPRPA